MPAQAPLAVWKGNTLSRTYRFKTGPTTPLDLTGSTLVFRAVWPDGTPIEKTLSIPTPTNGEAILSLSLAETRAIPTGDVAKYEIERRIGAEQTTLVFGKIIATEWVNDDD